MAGNVAVFALPIIQNDLGLSDAGRSWVITAYLIAFGGLLLLGGRLGDTFGRKRAFIAGVVLFTVASALCGFAWNEGVLVVARLLHGAAAAIIAPNSLALMSTTFPKGPVRNAAMAVLGALSGVGAVVGLVGGAALTDVSWRLAFLVNVPFGLLVIYLAVSTLQETQKERMKLDAAGAALATLTCAAAVFTLSMGPEDGWLTATTITSGAVVVAGFVTFVWVERTAENPVLPFSLFRDRSRLATFTAIFLSGGMTFTLTLIVALYVQNVLGYTPWHAGISLLPYAAATIIGIALSTRLVTWLSPRTVVFVGSAALLSVVLFSSTFNRNMPYFPNLVVPTVVAGISITMISVALSLSLVASVDTDRIGPTAAIAMMLQSLGGPLILAVIQAVITSHTLRLGGTSGPLESLNIDQLNALDHGYAYGLFWLSAVAALLGVVSLFIGYSAQQVAHAQEVNTGMDVEEL